MKKRILLVCCLVFAFIAFFGYGEVGMYHSIRNQSENIVYNYENIVCEKVFISNSDKLFWCNADFFHTHTFLGSDEEKLVLQVSRNDDMLYAYLTEHDDRSWYLVFVKKGMRIGRERYTAIKEPVCETKTNIRSLAKIKTQFDDFYVVFKKR